METDYNSRIESRGATGVAPLEGLQPIRQSRLYEQVADRLREFIAERDLKPGDRLATERDLARELAVSRTSIRQALTALSVLGIIEIRHGEGAYVLGTEDELVARMVREVLKAELDQPMVFEVRQGLETQAARLAARHRTEDDVARLKRTFDAMEAAIIAGGEGVKEDREFHRAVIAAARNPLLTALFEFIEEALDRDSEPSPRLAGRKQISLPKHRDILEAICARNEALAARRVRAVVASGARRPRLTR